MSQPLNTQQPILNQQSLAELPVGARARVVEIQGGRELTRRLLALGLRLGSEIRVQHHRRRGVVVSAGAARIALGGGMVEKLVVIPLPTDDAPERVDRPAAG